MSDRGFPDGVVPTPQHLRAGIVAYAAGDALGVPWEGSTPDEVRWEAAEALPPREGWPQGATSDDTAQLLLVAEYLVETNGQVDERHFLGRLANALPGMRGAGPTTQAAVRRPSGRTAVNLALSRLHPLPAPAEPANEASGRRGRASPSGRAGELRRQASSKVVPAGRAPDVPYASVGSGHSRTTTVLAHALRAVGLARTELAEGASQARGGS